MITEAVTLRQIATDVPEFLQVVRFVALGGLNEVNRTTFEAAVDHTGTDTTKRRGFLRCDHAAALCASGAPFLLRYAGSVDDEDLRSFDIAFHFLLSLPSAFVISFCCSTYLSVLRFRRPSVPPGTERYPSVARKVVNELWIIY